MKIKQKFIQISNYFILTIVITLAISCGTRQDVVYFQDIDLTSTSKGIHHYSPVIGPDDMLTITVSALDQDLARPFNLSTMNFSLLDGVGRPAVQSYLVDAKGNIDFPVLGTLKLDGLNRIQATSLIKNMLVEYIKNPIVNIRIVNFKITVLGEVNRPGSYTIPNERVTILEAIGLAGDLTIQAERKNILVVRENNGQKINNRVDITSETIFNSPVYYLTQNDVIYVQPNNSKIKSSNIGPNTNTTLSVIGTLVTVAALIISITR